PSGEGLLKHQIEVRSGLHAAGGRHVLRGDVGHVGTGGARGRVSRGRRDVVAGVLAAQPNHVVVRAHFPNKRQLLVRARVVLVRLVAVSDVDRALVDGDTRDVLAVRGNHRAVLVDHARFQVGQRPYAAVGVGLGHGGLDGAGEVQTFSDLRTDGVVLISR